MSVSFKIQVQAPLEKVFDYLSDVSRHAEWANPKASMKMSQVAGTGPGPDARYLSEAIFVKKPVSADISVTKFDRPSHFTIRSDQHQEGKKDVWYVNDFALSASSGGTLVTKTVSTGTTPAILYIAYPAIRSDAMTALRNLKAKLESAP